MMRDEIFFKEELRSNYLVSTPMKKVWSVELDLLQNLLTVCDKYNLKIYASGGTMLGAVRHQGFIPWDDDIDMMMMREDYEKLCAIAPKEFESPYFFQTEDSDPGSLRGHAQLRNSDTTAILEIERGRKYTFNQGIFIDIFPLDSVVDNKVLFYIQYFQALFFRKLSTAYGILIERKNIFRQERVPPNVFFKKFISVCKKYNYMTDTKMVSTLSFIFNKKTHQKFRSDFEEIVLLPFENVTIPIVKNYELALVQEYGNWKEFKPDTSNHQKIFFDPEKSYVEYIFDTK